MVVPRQIITGTGNLRAQVDDRRLTLLTLTWLCFVTSTACNGEVNYADDPDLTATRTAFQCQSPQAPEQQRACAAITRFEQAGPVKSYATSGDTTYLGLVDCTDSRGESISFSIRGLRGGTPPTKVDARHRAPGIMIHTNSHIAPNALRRAAAERTLEALRQRASSPGLTSEQLADDLIPGDWVSWSSKLGSSASTPAETAQSDGTSLLFVPGHIPAMLDDAEKMSAFAFLREIDDELIYIQPPSKTPGGSRVSCVEHLYRLP